tara:strand:+ start:2380 stop:2748 length:369 start_codon:yes stop_codon:yes gene_type:complete
MPVDTDKLIDLLIKYKTQVSYLIAFIACVGCFVGGYSIQKCKPKSEVCRAEENTITGLRAELAAKDTVRTQQLREQRDEDRLSCDERVEAAKQAQLTANDFLGCSDICTLHPQCYQAGRCSP